MKKSFVTPVILTVLTFSFVAANAVELPDMKPGLWETSIQHTSSRVGGREPRKGTTTHCLDQKTQAGARQTASDYSKKNCSKNETRQDGATWVTDMVCKVDSKTTMTTHSVTTFAGQEAYHTEMTTSFEPSVGGRSNGSTIVDGKWMGACVGK
jgi:hypothetical protein